ncbi:DUF885 family protein [Zunongwangia atlantica]|uniref:X-Pro dipeptidyl-peptidase n=1 Tax=Zunongwangia atlantica 22II14-10F7 TaxID=1185767 RepID=A0A1Y1SZS1_9FLAO|nr:DUF885 family protein [Zunongwangia atlantica]ORL43855.1 X-Pro dipeptidyl-peptidase [Zunongwangia atlantica 22II14-10F7]
MKKLLSCLFVFISLSSSIYANEMIDVINTFRADKFALRRTYNIRESKEYYERYNQFYSAWETKLKDIDFNGLSKDGKADYVLLRNLIEKEEYLLNQDYDAFKEVASVVDFADNLYSFIKQRRRGNQPDAKALAMAFNDAEKKISEKIKALKNNEFEDWLKAEKAAAIIYSLQRGLGEAYKFYYDYDPDFTWWMKTPYASLDQKLKEYAEFLSENYSKDSQKDDGSGIIGKPVGRKTLIKNLEYEFIPYTPEELIETAESQFAWCKAEMIKAANEMGYGDDWKAALEHVKNTYVAPGKQPEAINSLYDHSVEFIEERDLITIPELAKETWGMIMMTPERQKVNPFFTGGWEISISYPTEGMEHEDKLMSMRGNNPNFSFPTVQHELHPGHNLQFYMNQRNKPYRSSFDTPFWMEGWALYWEIILWNKDFPRTPEEKMGMLFWRIHRCARIIFSLKYQLGEWTPQQCIDMLVDEVGHEYANAEAEVRRSFATSYTPPLYQLAYMIGGLQFYALRNELLEKGWTEKEFHDRVMKEHMMPVAVLRLLLEDKEIPKNYKANWKFSTEFK